MRLPKRRPIKNPYAEAEQFRRRAVIGFLGIALALAGLGFGYFRLQVLQHDEYATRSEANRIKPRPLVPARGLIYDRNGNLLADNISAYRLEIVPEQVNDLPTTLAELRKLVALSDDDIDNFNATRKATRGFWPVVLKLKLSESELATLAVNRYRFPGVEVVPYLTRRYPYGEQFAHVVGYVGRLDAADLKALSDSSFAALSHTGKSGIERYYEAQLRGVVGYEEVEKNVEGRARGVLRRHPATPGADLQLSIDVNLQRAAVAAFGDHDGAAVAVDPRTGEVLALVSLPSFDPNLFINGISHADYRALTENLSRPLFNRNLQGGTPPGSTVKPFVALAGLESGVRRPEDRIFSSGEFHIPGVKRGFRDAEAGGVGWVDMRDAIALSVNTYFYQLALDLGIDRFDQYLGHYGFGRRSGIDLIGENMGILPSPAWKLQRYKQQWYLGETVNSGIGQGYWKVTSLQLAAAVSSLAADGVRHPLHLARATRSGFNTAWQPLPLPPSESLGASAEHLQVIKEGMEAVVSRGTARSIGFNAPYLIAGKTGTAQTISRKGNISVDPRSLPISQRHQALFIGYAPADHPQIAVAVVVEHGGFGASTAAPIARAIMDAWLLKKLPGGAPVPESGGKPAPPIQDLPDDVPSTEDASPQGDTPAQDAPAATETPSPDQRRVPRP